MRKLRSPGPGFLLLGAAMVFAGGAGAALAFGAALVAHELGHLTALFLLDGRVKTLRLTMSGPVIEYDAALTCAQERAVIAAGPLCGVAFAGLCVLTDRPFFLYTGALSLLTSAFNLLPALPLDGGRLMLSLLGELLPERTAARAVQVCGCLCAAGVAAAGLRAGSFPVAAAGMWLAVLVNVPKMR